VIVVVGGGTMGAGIATSFLLIGEEVTIVESDDEFVEGARGRVTDSLRRLAAKRDDLDPDEAFGRRDVRTDHGSAEAEMVIEAVPEDLALKQALFESLEDLYPVGTIFASNTSSLSITAMASVLTAPGRFVGMHFFNPVPVSRLVELVVGDATDGTTVATARAWVERLDKTPIVVNDSPGFASSRLGIALGMEAIRMVEAGVASAADIDAAMQLGYQHPMGPLKLTDLVGLDIRLAIAEHLAVELGERFEPPELLRSMVADGKLGKKTGEGFYIW